MQTDRQGNALTGATATAAALFDEAVEAFNLYDGDPVAPLDRALAEAPGFAMARLAKAELCLLATEPAAAQAAADILAELRDARLGEREASHLAATELLAAGEWTAAAIALERHSMRWPHDLLALQVGHLCDFYRANARTLRDRIARALPHWDEGRPGYSTVLGFYAFGLEEAGDYARAEAMGREAIARQPRDCWAHHAVAHVMEMQGRAEDGIGWMRTREPFWSGADNIFQGHNWWHLALFHLEVEDPAAALAIFDDRLAEATMALDLVDASALLWRLQASGHDVGGRWAGIADGWAAHADGRLYAFNDWHAAMAYLGAGREAEVERLLEAHRSADRHWSENAAWAHGIGRPLIEGFRAFAHGDHATAVERLYGARHVVNAFGGSHAQRDVIDWTLAEAAVRAGMTDLATALADERLALRPHCPLLRTARRRLAETAGTATLAA